MKRPMCGRCGYYHYPTEGCQRHCVRCGYFHTQGDCPTTSKVEGTLNQLPEVTWDRWSGDMADEFGIVVFGWIARQDGKSDFVVLRIDKDGCWSCITSSAKYSEEFARRLRLHRDPTADPNGEHSPCRRVEDYFRNVKCVRLASIAN